MAKERSKVNPGEFLFEVRTAEGCGHSPSLLPPPPPPPPKKKKKFRLCLHGTGPKPFRIEPDRICFCLHGTFWRRSKYLHGTFLDSVRNGSKLDLQNSKSSFGSVPDRSRDPFLENPGDFSCLELYFTSKPDVLFRATLQTSAATLVF